MADGHGKETSLGSGNMNGYIVNGIPQSKSPLPDLNGHNNATKSGPPQQSLKKSMENPTALTNGIAPATTVDLVFQRPLSSRTDQVPEELMEMLRTRIPDDAYVPMARLISRAAKTCWSQLIATLNELAQVALDDPRTITKRMRPPDQVLVNDDTSENQRKKTKLWNFAEHHKRVLIKLLVILMWSSKSEDNKLTIALNYEIHAMRSAFSNANDKLNEWIVYIVSRQDACPDLDTALEVLATGRIADVPDLGFVEEKSLSEKQMLSTIKRLNRVLSARMIYEEDLPLQMRDWHVHDGRVTFKVPHEFELDLSIMTDESDAPFMLVDVRFDFRPRAVLPDDVHDQLTTITNQGLLQKGLHGAYEFLHHFCLTLKLKELHSQALTLAGGHWANHLGVELLKRTLIVQYWTTRTSTKSWIVIGINSGRANLDTTSQHSPTSYLYLRWMKNGRVMADNEINLDLAHISFESIINQVVAQHTNSIFTGIFDKLVTENLYAENELHLEQDSSLVDAFDCRLQVGISESDNIQLSCDPVAGTIVISPPTLRSNRLQHELARSKNIVDDFVARLPALRCAIAQTAVLDATQGTSLRYLPGRKPTAAQVRSRFGPNTLRAAFFTQIGWSSEWTLAAAFGRDEDVWWLVHEPISETSPVQVYKLSFPPIHVQRSLNQGYFDLVQKTAGAEITMQVSRHALETRSISVQEISEGDGTRIAFSVGVDQNLESIDRRIIAWPASSKRASRNSAALLVRVRLRASKGVLRKLASADLDPSITVHAEKQVLLLSLSSHVGGNKVDELMDRLHYIDDLISCIRLVDGIKRLSMQSLSMQNIVINYHHAHSQDLGLKLYFQTGQSKAKLQLLPAESNPHNLVSEHVNRTLADSTGPLSDRLRSILSVLTATLPLLNALQCLQGRSNASIESKMQNLNLDESRKWIKMHVMSRDMIRFAVHLYALTPNFKKDVELEVTSPKLLVRLEIETGTNESGSKQGWIIRPAVEEFRTYSRPSFTSLALAQRLREKIFSYTDGDGWMGLGSAARCLFENPYDLLSACHQVVLEWLKEADTKGDQPNTSAKTEASVGKPQAPSQGTKQQNVPQARPQAQTQPPNVKGSQSQGQRPFQQGRPAGAHQAPNQNASSRVMTAQPQQMRQPVSQGRGRGQAFLGRGGQQQMQQRPGPGGGGTQNDAIQLD